MSTAHRLDRALSWVENGIAALALGAAVTLSIAGVILRYLFDYVVFWSEEASLNLVILSTFVGASIALRHKDHVGVDFLAVATKGRARKAVNLLGALITLVYCVLFAWVGWAMVTRPVASSFRTSALELPLWVVQLAVPVGLTLMLIRTLQIVWRTIRDREPYPDAQAEQRPEEEAAT